MGVILELFGMGRKKNKHKQRQKQKQYNHQQNRSDRKVYVFEQNASRKNGGNHISRKENIFNVALDVFGAKYYCIGDQCLTGNSTN